MTTLRISHWLSQYYRIHFPPANQSGHTSPEEDRFFLFLSRSTMHSSVKSPLRQATVKEYQGDWLKDQSSDLVFPSTGWMPAELVGCQRCWSDASGPGRRSAILVGSFTGRKRSERIVLQNTECSGTSCRGIDPYTIMAAHGPLRRRWPSSQD
jgi:hypothetical protein